VTRCFIEWPLFATTWLALAACHGQPVSTEVAPPAPAHHTLPELETLSPTARCPGVLARVVLEAEPDFADRLELVACPMPEDGAFDPTASDKPPTARLQLFDARGTPTDTMALEADRAALEVIDAYGDGRPMFIVTVDLSCGMGSYCGPRAQFFEVANGKLRTVTLAEKDKDGSERKLWLIRSLNNAWKLAPARAGHGLDVLAVSTHPDLDTDGGPALKAPPRFVTSVRRYAYEAGRWRVHERVYPADALANESDDNWPRATAFP
jgi:hypothetical protein